MPRVDCTKMNCSQQMDKQGNIICAKNYVAYIKLKEHVLIIRLSSAEVLV